MLQIHPPSSEIPFVGGPLNGQKTTKRAHALRPDGSTAPTDAVSLNDWSAYHAFAWIRSSRSLPRWEYYVRLRSIGRGLIYLWVPRWCRERLEDLLIRDPEVFALEWQTAVKQTDLQHVVRRYAMVIEAGR
jgi:hypothetical protein